MVDELKEVVVDKNRQDFLKSSETAMRLVEGLNMQGFQLGGGAVDFVLGKYRRPHSDIDMVYVVNSRNWEEYVSQQIVPDERISLGKVNQKPELFGVRQTTPIAMERMGAPGIQMQGGELPLVVDFIEAYKIGGKDERDIMLPIYGGSSYIKIPSKEIVGAEIDGVVTRIVSGEVQYLLKEQAVGLKRTLQGGPFPDRREKSFKDMEELRNIVDMDKVKRLKLEGVGFNFSLTSAAKFSLTKLYKAIVG